MHTDTAHPETARDGFLLINPNESLTGIVEIIGFPFFVRGRDNGRLPLISRDSNTFAEQDWIARFQAELYREIAASGRFLLKQN